MKIETILNAYDKVHQTIIAEAGGWLFLSFEHISKRKRQYRAFRDRILRMDAEKDAQIRFLNIVIDKCEDDIKKLEESFGIYSTGGRK